MESIVNSINDLIWSKALIYLCLGAGLFFSIITRFVQVRLFKEMWFLLFDGSSSKKGISSFQALSVSLSGRVGVGNIAGVAAAIGFGGPGAVFWMWVVAFLGASTAYVESTLGQIYKEDFEGQYRGGPAFYFEKCFGNAAFGIIFAISTIIACGLFLPGVQANSIGSALEEVFGSGTIISTSFGEIGLYKIISLTFVLLLLAFIIFGGIKRIAHFAQVIVPFMALGYILVAVIICLLHIKELPAVFWSILSDAFTPMAGFGAAVGWGVKRGVYSNEAGQGTGPHAAAAAEVQHPAQQGLVQAFSVYIDTLFVCSATAFMILITKQYNVVGANPAEPIIAFLDLGTNINSPAFTQAAAESVFGGFGKPFIAIALFFFAFTTILAYYYIAETNIAYIKRYLKLSWLSAFIKLTLMFSVFYGTINASGYIWLFGDIGVGLMAWLNIVGILAIFFAAKPSIIALKDYEMQRKQKVENYTFNPVKLGIKHADFWEHRLAKNKNSSSDLNKS